MLYVRISVRFYCGNGVFIFIYEIQSNSYSGMCNFVYSRTYMEHTKRKIQYKSTIDRASNSHRFILDMVYTMDNELGISHNFH